MIDYRVYLVTDDPSRYAGDWLENVVAAVEGGVTCVQYRDTESADAMRYARCRALKDVLDARGVPLVVNNSAELARALGAAGVHVGQGDLPPAEVRAIVGRRCEIGYSVTSLDDVRSARYEAARPHVDCLGIGPVFDATKTKVDASPAMGVDGLAEIVAYAPTFANCAIGGITLQNAARVLAAGAKGLAVVSAFSKAVDPYATAREFALLFDNCRK